jgi:predicted nucleic acid-binding protein
LSSGLLRYPLTEGIAQRAAAFVGRGLTGYDAFYVALAEELDALWLTFDSRAHSLLQLDDISIDLSVEMPRDWPRRPSQP